jgi:hypothetical protein
MISNNIEPRQKGAVFSSITNRRESGHRGSAIQQVTS